MPYVPLPDGTKLWYRTNMHVKASKPICDSSKPTVLLIQCMSLTTFTDLQLQDGTLNPAFNLISFDARSTGKTEYLFDARKDTWMDAADLAQAILLLDLPPLHVFTAGGELSHVHAIELAVLWGDLVKTLTFVDAGAKPEDASEFQIDEDILNEVTREICSYEDLDMFERMGHELAMFIFGSGVSEEIADTMVKHFEVNYSGRNTPRFYDYMIEVFHEPSLDRSILTNISMPVLYIGSDCTTLSRPDIAIRPEELTSAEVQVEILQSPPQPHLREPWASHIHQTFKTFALTEEKGSDPTKAHVSRDVSCCMAAALERLSELTNRPDLLERDPLLSASFALTSEMIVQRRQPWGDEFQRLAQQKELGKILDEEGRPFRKYSERNDGENRRLKAARVTPQPIYLSLSETVEDGEEAETQGDGNGHGNGLHANGGYENGRA